MKYYSTATGCFYASEGRAPSPALEVTDEEHLAAINRGPDETLAIVDGVLVIVPASDEATLARARGEKAAEIDAAFRLAEGTPIPVNGWQFKGGFTSGLAIDAQRRAAEMHHELNPMAPDTVTFFDVRGTPVTVPLLSDTEIDAADNCLSISSIVSLNTFKYEQLRNAVWAATTAEDVAAISWGD